MFQSHSDADLLTAWQEGDEQALAVLVARHHGLVLAVCRRQAPPEEIDDCVQAVFLVLSRRPDAARKVPVLEAWLLRVALLVCRKGRRGRIRRLRAERAAAEGPASTRPEESPEALGHLDECLHRLPVRQREALCLHYLAGLDAADVAARLGTSRDQVYLLVHRGLAGLRALFVRRGFAVGNATLVAMLSTDLAAAPLPAATIALVSHVTAGSPSTGAAALAKGAIASLKFAALAPVALVVGPILTVALSTTVLVLASARIDLEVYAPPIGPGRTILTPPAPATPRVHGPTIVGVRPGSPFLYAIPATGRRPMTFAATGLPDGLQVDALSGRITGAVTATTPATHPVRLRASNDLGSDEKNLRIVVGDAICLTPPMGWNSRNCWHTGVDQDKVLAAAQAMRVAGLDQVGWTYLQIEDGWQGVRGGPFNAIQPNSKFPDLAGLVEEMHGMGFKIGLYSSPWRGSPWGFCGGSADTAEGTWVTGSPQGVGKDERFQYHTVGRFSFEVQDAQQWAAWGVDALRYDGNADPLVSTAGMHKALAECGRDIVLAVFNGVSADQVPPLAAHAHTWRTFGWAGSTWDAQGLGMPGLLDVWRMIMPWTTLCAPGRFPDADIIPLDEGHAGSRSALSAQEQITRVSLCALWSSPMQFSTEVDKMGDFTLSLLTNTEVIAINQDALGRMATMAQDDGHGGIVLAKPLEDGGLALGLVNRAEDAQVITVSWPAAGLQGPRRLRDVWRQRDLGVFQGRFSALVPGHGTVLLRATSTDGAVAAASGVMTRLPPEPTFDPPLGVVPAGTTVTLTGAPGTVIRLTLTGRPPEQDGRYYQGPLTITSYTRIKAVAIREGVASGVVAGEYLCPAPMATMPEIPLSQVPIHKSYLTWGQPRWGRTGRLDTPIQVNGRHHPEALGVWGPSEIRYAVDPSWHRFVAQAAVDDAAQETGAVTFLIKRDREVVAKSPRLRRGQTWAFDVLLPPGTGTLELRTVVDGIGDERDAGDWLDCGFIR